MGTVTDMSIAYKGNYVSVYLLCLSVFTSTLIQTGYGFSKAIGYCGLTLTSVILLLSFLKSISEKNELIIDSIAFLLCLYLLVLLFRINSIDTSTVKSLVSVCFYILFYVMARNVINKINLEETFSNVSKFFIVISLIVAVSNFSLKYSFIYNNSNSYGLLVFMFSFFIYMDSKKNNKPMMLWWIVILSSIFISGSRTALSSFIIATMVIKFYGLVSIVGSRVVFLLMSLIYTIIITAYMSLNGTTIGYAMTEFSRTHFNKNLYSGRQTIWSEILDSLSGIDLFFGKGTGVLPSSITGLDYSAHNSFIQILFQNGLAGLSVIAIMFYLTVPKNKEIERNKELVVITGYISAICFCAMWEVFILQNHPVLSCLTLLIISSSMSQRRGY